MDYKTFNQLEPGDTIYYLRNHELIKIFIEKIIEYETGAIRIYGKEIGTNDDFHMSVEKMKKHNTIYNNVVYSDVYELIKTREQEIENLKRFIQERICEKKYNLLNLIIKEIQLEKKTIKNATKW